MSGAGVEAFADTELQVPARWRLRRRAGTFRGAWRDRRWRWLLASYAVSMTGTPESLAVIDSAVVACAVLVLEGMGVILAEVLFITLLQRTSGERTLGTVYACRTR